MCLGLRCLHGLDGGSCYGMPRELVRGLPHMVAPGTLTCHPETRELRRTAMAPEYDAASCIHVLGPMLRLMLTVERFCGGTGDRTARSYGTAARGMGVYGGGGRNAAALAGSAGVGAGGKAAGPGEQGDGHGGREVRWPCAGSKAARDISRRVVAWAVGLARGWVADEERVQRAGGGGASGRGCNPWATLNSEKDMLTRAKESIGQLTVQAVKVYRSTLEEVGAGGGAAAGAGGGGKGGAGEEAACSVGGQRREGKGREQQQQQQQALLAEWYGLACSAASHAVHWPTGDNAVGDLAELMALGLPPLTHTEKLPLLPSPRLAAALSGGYLPCLDTLLRRCGRRFAPGDVVMTGLLLINDGSLTSLAPLLSSPGSAGNSSSNNRSNNSSSSSSSSLVFGFSHDLPYLLAYGNPRHSASLLVSMAKVLRRAARGDGDPGVGGGGGSSAAAPGMAAGLGNGAEELVAEGLASVLCRSLGAAFDWMQGAQEPGGCRRGRHPVCGRAPAGSAGGNPTAGGDSTEQEASVYGAAASWPMGPEERLRLLLSFALARVVPPLSAYLVRQMLPLLAEARAQAGGGRSLCPGDDPQTHLGGSLQHLLAVLAVGQKTVWRCRDLVSNTALEAAARTGSSTEGSNGRGALCGGGAPVAAAAGQGMSGAWAVELGALADGLQQLLDGEVDVAGLVGAALDCLQLLPASHRGQVAAAVLELTHCALWSCQRDNVFMRLPDGSRFLSFSASRPILKNVLWASSSSAEKLRAAVAAARFAGYAAEAKHGDALVMIASRHSPGCAVRAAPEVPLWLLTPGEVGRELGGSCCCNARCTRLEGDSEAGEGQGQGLLVCGRCRGAWYCCRECQAADWAAGHKKACKGK